MLCHSFMVCFDFLLSVVSNIHLLFYVSLFHLLFWFLFEWMNQFALFLSRSFHTFPHFCPPASKQDNRTNEVMSVSATCLSCSEWWLMAARLPRLLRAYRYCMIPRLTQRTPLFCFFFNSWITGICEGRVTGGRNCLCLIHYCLLVLHLIQNSRGGVCLQRGWQNDSLGNEEKARKVWASRWSKLLHWVFNVILRSQVTACKNWKLRTQEKDYLCSLCHRIWPSERLIWNLLARPKSFFWHNQQPVIKFVRKVHRRVFGDHE